MICTIKLEAIGDDFAQWAGGLRAAFGPAFDIKARRPWVAELTGWRGGRWFDREFLDGQKDYSEANGIGSRGVYVYYHLSEGCLYEVKDLLSRGRDRRYFCTVSDGQLVEMDLDEVQTALSERMEREAGLG